MKYFIGSLAILLLVGCPQSEPTMTSAPTETALPPAATAEKAPVPDPTPPCVPAPRRLCPVDEGTSDPSFASFRDAMRTAIANKDANALLAMVDPKIRTTFGAGGGLEDFKTAWKLESKESRLWRELDQILSMGGTLGGEEAPPSFWAPYIYSAWPETIDAFSYVAATRAGVPVRERADDSAAEVASLDWEIVERIDSARENETWVHIRTEKGIEGFVASSDVRSPVGYRAGFSRRSGEWKMDALVAGD